MVAWICLEQNHVQLWASIDPTSFLRMQGKQHTWSRYENNHVVDLNWLGKMI
jgi:hypothetical protein